MDKFMAYRNDGMLIGNRLCAIAIDDRLVDSDVLFDHGLQRRHCHNVLRGAGLFHATILLRTASRSFNKNKNCRNSTTIIHRFNYIDIFPIIIRIKTKINKFTKQLKRVP